MPLGDSITAGSYGAGKNGIGGYRAELWAKCRGTGLAVDFVGTWNDPTNATFNAHHQGWRGGRIDDLKSRLSGWMAQCQPEVILLQIGVNDLIKGAAAEIAASRFDSLLSTLHSASPEAKVYAASILNVLEPNDYKVQPTMVKQYNALIANTIAEHLRKGMKVSFVDLDREAALREADFSPDHLHPNDSGYAKMAEVWFKVLQSALTSKSACSLSISRNGRFFVDGNGQPFFWQGDTEWELFHSFTEADAKALMQTRRSQGFNVLQVMATGLYREQSLREGAMKEANPAQEIPAWLNNDPLQPNERYFQRMDAIVKDAERCSIGARSRQLVPPRRKPQRGRLQNLGVDGQSAGGEEPQQGRACVISKIRVLEVAKAADEVVAGQAALPIDPFRIAQSRDIMVKAIESNTPGVSGFLMKQGDAFGIGYSNRIKNAGYINFTVSHELGHYFIPGHVEKLFATGSGTHASRSGFISADPCEREADLFAASLLMPAGLFRKATRTAGEGFPAIERLASQCGTSITATAIRFAEFSENAVAVIVSDNGVADFCCLSPAIQELSGLTWMRRGEPIPALSITARFAKNPENIASGVRSEGYSMLDEWLDGAPRIEMKEDVVGLGHYGKALTVLFTNEEVESEEPDEEDDSFERWQRWEKRQ